MSASVIFVCDSCGRYDVAKIEEFSALPGSLIPKRWSITQRENRPPRILCIGCVDLPAPTTEEQQPCKEQQG